MDAKLLFFGVWHKTTLGHHLYESTGRWADKRQFPFKFGTLDGGLLNPYTDDGTSGDWQLSNLSGWTVISKWDRTGDGRPGSNCSFIAAGHYTLEAMKEMAAQQFPLQWKRINQGN